MRCSKILVLLFSLSLIAGSPWCLLADEIDHRRDVVYGRGGMTELHLDIAIPRDLDQPAACVVVIHGGAWRAGDKRQHEQQILEFARRGYVSASIQYRLCPQHQFPAQVEDVKCAVRYLRAHADQYRIDPTRIGAVGFSAGAHLAMMLGTTDADDRLEGDGGWPDQSSRVQAVVSFFGPTALGADDIPDRSEPLVEDFLGGPREQIPQVYQRASPLNYVSEGDAPMLLYQGTEDVLVPYTQAIEMVHAMTAADVPGRVEFLIEAGHGWGGDDLQRTADETHRFFARYLEHLSK